MLDIMPARISEWLLLVVKSQRSIAHLLIDNELVLIKAGGELEYYGLADLERQNSASDQLPFLEGMLPLEETPFLLESVGMPSGRVADVHFFAEGNMTWVVLLDVTAEHDDARKIQQKAYDMTLLNVREARLMAKLETAHKELTLAHSELAESRDELRRVHDRLQRELRDAERYVLAILPPPVMEPFPVDWLFVPSTELGGDSFGYHWIDDEHFALYLLDVCGHGVNAALLSISVMNVLRNQGLARTDFRSPTEVLAGLNRAFQMERNNDMYFTMWYGVYDKQNRRLTYATGGHPPAILMGGASEETAQPLELSKTGAVIGVFPEMTFDSEAIDLPAFSRLYVFSDGIYEVLRPDGTMLEYSEFVDILAASKRSAGSIIKQTVGAIQNLHGGQQFEDDVSIVEVTF
jgi:serine phosphatase RsbU (regulator of sigma subunit)